MRHDVQNPSQIKAAVERAKALGLIPTKIDAKPHEPEQVLAADATEIFIYDWDNFDIFE